MGKRPGVRRRGRGGMQFRAATTQKLKAAKYPSFTLDEERHGDIIDLTPMKITVRAPDGRTCDLDVNPEDTIPVKSR